jgi:SNF2 family DNA or RNA helicase
VLEIRPGFLQQESSATPAPFGLDPSISPVRPAFSTTPEQDVVGALPLDDVLSVPASINRFLRPYQREGVKFFHTKYKANTGGILGDDMG